MAVDAEHDLPSTRQNSYSPTLRLDLQGMRAFAVLAVFATHLFGWPRGGFVGVDVFFVLSGFFITALLIKERTRTRHISLQSFYIRRVRRIIPSALLVIAVTVLASYLLLTPTRAKGALIDGLWAAIFLSNWRFERVGTDYFAQGLPPSPLLHYWTLSIEEQFYFVWPLLLLGLFALTRRYSKRHGRYGPARQAWLAGCMAAICLLSFGLAFWQYSWSPTGAYFSTYTRVWELGVGALVAIGAPLLGRIPRVIRPYLSYFGLAGAVGSMFVITPESVFPAPWAALPVLSTAVVIAAFVGAEPRGVPHLTNRVALYIGAVSYTLYLWHWPVIILLTAVMPRQWPFYVLVIVLAMGLTVVTYRFYENPIRQSTWLEGRRSTWLEEGSGPRIDRRDWAIVGALATIVVFASALMIEIDERRSGDSQGNQALVVVTEAPKASPNRCRGAAALTTPDCVLYDPSKPLVPNIKSFDTDTQGAYECFQEDANGPLRSCTYGDTRAGAKRIALVGDSHAAMILPALSPYLVENEWSVTTFLGRGCYWMARHNDDCAVAMPQAQEKLLADKFDLVITMSFRTRPRNEIVDYLDVWRPVADAGSKILVVADVPTIASETLDCLTRIRVGGFAGDCATSRSVALADPDELLAVAQQTPGTQVLDMTDSFCSADICPAVIGNVIVYRDTNSHMTATYVKTLSPQLVTAIKEALG